jgi:hypothetical protein
MAACAVCLGRAKPRWLMNRELALDVDIFTRVNRRLNTMDRGDFVSAAKLADLENLAKAVGILERNNQMQDFFADMYSFENAELLGPELMGELRGLIDKYGRMEVFKVCQWLPKIIAAAES